MIEPTAPGHNPNPPFFSVLVDPSEYATALARRLGYMDGQHHGWTLYRFHDDHGRILYVGVTSRQAERWTTHRRESQWWPQIAYVTCQRFSHEHHALSAERVAIKAERPRYNVRSAVAV